ncbi:MAG: hypothetical protein COV76_01870 [Candidatus Omnitrophica bacterium CG11_big_fil_rev_8_21_14_0_20_64_10]|nr:MAG: hypothetical protein COV76_01870 [Candidatus Omnitrophica bacterium CG11_big_fil_rev_8_21_14_0_20_64_10]
MIRFRKITVEWEFAEVKKICRTCGEAYVYYAYRGGDVYHSCMECEKCQERLWYYPEEDSVLDKYFGEQGKRGLAGLQKMAREIETLASPCSCGGFYRHIDVSEAGVPKNCLHCRAPEDRKDELFPIDRGIETISPDRKKRPVTVLDFYDDSLPDFSNSSPEELRDALKNPDPVHKRRALMAILKLKGPFPYPDDLLHLASETTDSATQRLCVETLGKKGNVSAIPYMIGLLNGKKHEPRASAEHALLMITSQLIPKEFEGFIRLKHPEGKAPSTPDEWKRWWQEHKDTVKIRDYPPHIKERMGMA